MDTTVSVDETMVFASEKIFSAAATMVSVAEKIFFVTITMVFVGEKIFSVTVTMVFVGEKIFSIMQKIFSSRLPWSEAIAILLMANKLALSHDFYHGVCRRKDLFYQAKDLFNDSKDLL